MDNILLLIKKRNQIKMKIKNIEMGRYNTKCNLKKHFFPKNEDGMYIERIHVSCICGYEKLL